MPPNANDGKENPARVEKWRVLNDRLSMELGVEYLSASHYQGTYYGQQSRWPYSMEMVCKNFLQAEFGGNPDRFMKERLSLVELAFRFHADGLATRERNLPQLITEAKRQAARLTRGYESVDQSGAIKDSLNRANSAFASAVAELNERFRQAELPLHYHNGFIQISEDSAIEKQIEEPFWRALADPLWENVDTDMKEAIDRRDGDGRDSALYAAKALESTIKIISDKKGWTHGGEKGAHNYIDNLAAAKNGGFLAKWEATALKQFFTDVRNPLGHGPGDKPMLELNPQQADWAIQTCMAWIKSLIGRV
jgi:hypothetical protein